MLVEPIGRHEIHDAETTGIVEGHRHAGRHPEDDVVVAVLEIGVAIAPAWPPRGRLRPEPSGHAEMHDQRVSGRQHGEQILAAACERPHALAAEPPREAGGERPSEVGAIQDDAIEARAGHRALQTLPYALDLGKFRHK